LFPSDGHRPTYQRSADHRNATRGGKKRPLVPPPRDIRRIHGYDTRRHACHARETSPERQDARQQHGFVIAERLRLRYHHRWWGHSRFVGLLGDGLGRWALRDERGRNNCLDGLPYPREEL